MIRLETAVIAHLNEPQNETRYYFFFYVRLPHLNIRHLPSSAKRQIKSSMHSQFCASYVPFSVSNSQPDVDELVVLSTQHVPKYLILFRLKGSVALKLIFSPGLMTTPAHRGNYGEGLNANVNGIDCRCLRTLCMTALF